MATSRGTRMQERMRGAGRHEVADDSFGFILPVEEASEPPLPNPEPQSEDEPTPTTHVHAHAHAPTPTPTSNTSAKRRRLGDAATTTNAENPQASPQRQNESQSQPPSTASKAGPYDMLQDESQETETESLSSARRTTAEADLEGGNEDNLGSLPKAIARPTSRDSISSRLSVGPHVTEEEVTESPAAAPGSGHRRRVRVNTVATQSAQLQRMVMDQEAGDTAELATSSPLARKTRMSGVTPSALSTRSIRTIGRSTLAQSAMEADELSPVLRPSRKSNSTAGSGSARSSLSAARRSTLDTMDGEPDELSSPVPPQERLRPAQTKSNLFQAASLVENRRKAQERFKAKRSKQATSVIVTGRESEVDPDDEEHASEDVEVSEQAEEIQVEEAAQVLGKKRRRPSPPRDESPELDAPRDISTVPTKKRRQKRSQDSPAKQSQPKAVKQKKHGEKPKRKRHSGEDELVPITVQRYTRRQQYNEGDTDADILGAEIPFANRSGVNVVDVLTQMCDEVIDSNLTILHEAALTADSSAAKKEYRTKLRALEAFQEELRTRLLEHTIALDNLHSLKKRVRSIQKEKLALRNDIIRIRAEREQVALKMDAVRIRHEKNNKQTLDQLNLSTTMHNIDLAVENGRQAAELGPKEQKNAELANLELLVSRIAGQVTTGEGNGNLQQIQDFNAFLERAAAALEAR
ncbi:hypothetical protein TruAng_000882 [Truncatella angustata]|nr:hypothetical protein TruAng_000882 [Truncatella angustata]